MASQEVVQVWDEFGNAEAVERPAGRSRRSQPAQPAQPAVAAAQQLAGSPPAQAWLESLARFCESAQGSKSKAQLMELLRCGGRSRDQVVAVQNRARLQIAKLFSWTHHVEDPPGLDSPARARQCQYLFERVLHGVLLEALAQQAAASGAAGSARSLDQAVGGVGEEEGEAAGETEDEQDGGGGAAWNAVAAAAAAATLAPAERDRVVEVALADAELQLGLVNACVETVNYAYMQGQDRAFPWATLQLGRLRHTLELWQGCDWVVDFLEAPPAGAEGVVPGIPHDVCEYLAAIQVRVEEELAFIDAASLYARIMDTGAACGKGSSGGDGGNSEAGGSPGKRRRRSIAGSRHTGRTEAGAALIARFLSNLARTAMMRAYSLCKELLAEYPALQEFCPELPSRVCAVVDQLLGQRLELLFGQHSSVVVACAIYYTVRLHGGVLPFRKITALAAAVLPNHDEQTFGCVELPPVDGTGWDGSREHGDTRAFYNRVFLPAFQQYEAADLFGDDALPPTPAKQQLEAHDMAADSTATVQPSVGAGGGRLLAPEHAQRVQAGAAGGAANAAADSGKEARKLRRPLGQVTNRDSGGSATRGGSVLRAR